MSGTMRDAMLKAGLIKTDAERYEEWKTSSYKNRFGGIALFEIWNISKIPKGHWKSCALCGKSEFESIIWKAPTGLRCCICPMCYVHGRKLNGDNFPGLEER